MLCLTRKLDEEIVIDGQIIVKVIEVKGSRVKLGITAPKHVTIHRPETERMIARMPRPMLGVG